MGDTAPMPAPPKSARILVAMSGGVDSAVTAALIARAGYDCIGVTMRLVPEHEGKSPFEPCCGLEAAEDARRVCEKLDIPHEVMYSVDRFDRDIIDHFVEEYQAGRTPNPCVRCNRMIKFGALYQRADELGADYIAMGHYARLGRKGDRIGLRRAVYRPKDQSYVLAPLQQPQLRRAWFPLGDMTKQEVRDAAWTVDFAMATKKESMEICFVPDRDYAKVVASRGGDGAPGPILSLDGEELGRHDGLIHYTLGQRRGLGIASERPLYVVRLDADRNAVIVAHEDETQCHSFATHPVCWGALPPQHKPFDCLVQLRSRHDPVPAQVAIVNRRAVVTLPEPQRAVTPSQWAVFYDRDGFVLASAMVKTFELVPATAAAQA